MSIKHWDIKVRAYFLEFSIIITEGNVKLDWDLKADKIFRVGTSLFLIVKNFDFEIKDKMVTLGKMLWSAIKDHIGL